MTTDSTSLSDGPEPPPRPNEGNILESPEEVLSTLGKDGKRKWMYPTLSEGVWLTRRTVVGWALIVLFMALPLIPIGGKPAVFLDVANREFTFFGGTLYATDTLVLMLFLLSVFVSVFFATALLGRAWCGWGCPQTVYMEFVFRPIERLIEGNERARRKADEGPDTLDKTARKVAKYAAFTAVALVMAHTFVAYFVSWPQLIAWMTGPPTEHWGIFLLMAATTAAIVLDFAYFREQMCTIACPYARLQSVLVDRDSLIVSYDAGRGEARGRRTRAYRKALEAGTVEPLGDCVDCGACVRTCPTGIDIRDGLQMECIGCTQCIDACDAIMDKLGQPGGLVRYTSENSLENTKPRIVRPRLVIYALLFVVMVSGLVAAVHARGGADFNITRATGAPFITMPEGQVANRLKFRIQNRSGAQERYTIVPATPEGLEVKIVGRPELVFEDGEQRHVEAWVVVPPERFERGAVEGVFELHDKAGVAIKTLEFNLLGPWDGPHGVRTSQ